MMKYTSLIRIKGQSCIFLVSMRIVFFRLILLFVLICLGFDGICDSIICRMPFTVFKNQIIITIKVNDSDSLNFIFDTGNENAHIDSTTAANMNLKTVKYQEVHCTGGESYIPVVLCDYTLGDLKLCNVETTTGIMNNYSRILKRRIDGIIGQDIMRNHVIKLDFDSNIMEVHPMNYQYREKAETLDIMSRGPTIHAKVIMRNGQVVEGDFIVDTGSNSSLTLNSGYTDTSKLKELIGEYKIYNTYDMCGNVQIEYEGKAKNLIIGSAQTDLIPTTLSIVSEGVLAEKQYAGLIGTPVLRCFTMVIDMNNKQIFMQSNSALKDYSKNAKH
jgi:hypothetical protein